MNSEFDVFEILPDRSLVWLAYARGAQCALKTLKIIGEQTSNECFAINLETREIFGRVNEVRSTPQINANDDQSAAT